MPRARAPRPAPCPWIAALLLGVVLRAAPAPACEAMLGKEYVEPPEGVQVDLDPARWQVAARAREATFARKEYVLEDQTLADWSELVSWQVDFPAVHADLSGIEASYLARLRAQCSTLRSRALPSGAGSRMVEWWDAGCYGRPPQHEIARWIAGATGTHQLSYGVRGKPLRGAERKRWIERIAGARLRDRLEGGAESEIDRARRQIWGRDYAAAVLALRPLAEAGSAEAQGELARLYFEGWGVPLDYTESLRWLERAAVQRDAAALFDLGRMYEKGFGVVSDRARALQLYREAAELGDAEAQGHVGYLALTDEKPDYATARTWFERSAAGGHVDAIQWLGRMLEEGWAMEPDPAQAAETYRRAAVQGSADAQYRLGRMYASGKGVEPSDAAAIRWLTRAAMQGQPEARAFYAYRYPAAKALQE